MSVGIDIEASDVEEQERRMGRFDATVGRHFRGAAEEGVRQVVGAWRAEAPVGESGRYRGSIRGGPITVTGLQVRAVSSATAVNPLDRFGYPGALEMSRRYRLRPGGKPSKGAMGRLLWSQARSLMARFQRALEAALHELAVR